MVRIEYSVFLFGFRELSFYLGVSYISGSFRSFEERRVIRIVRIIMVMGGYVDRWVNSFVIVGLTFSGEVLLRGRNVVRIVRVVVVRF